MGNSTFSPIRKADVTKDSARFSWSNFGKRLGGSLAGAAATATLPFLAGISRRGQVTQAQSQVATEAQIFSSPNSITRNIGLPVLVGVGLLGALAVGGVTYAVSKSS